MQRRTNLLKNRVMVAPLTFAAILFLSIPVSANNHFVQILWAVSSTAHEQWDTVYPNNNLVQQPIAVAEPQLDAPPQVHDPIAVAEPQLDAPPQVHDPIAVAEQSITNS